MQPYRETVMNSKLQFESPISKAEAIPAGANCAAYGLHINDDLFRRVHLSQMILHPAARRNLTTRCVITMLNG